MATNFGTISCHAFLRNNDNVITLYRRVFVVGQAKGPKKTISDCKDLMYVAVATKLLSKQAKVTQNWAMALTFVRYILPFCHCYSTLNTCKVINSDSSIATAKQRPIH